MDLSICRSAEMPLSRAHRQAAHDEHDDQYRAGAVQALQEAGVEHAVGEAADVADAQHRAGHGHGQHGWQTR